MQMSKERVLITILSAIGVLAAFLLPNGTISAGIVVVCALAASLILYRKLPELSNVSPDNPKVKTLRFVTIFNIVVILGLLAFSYLAANEIITISEKTAVFILPVIFAVVIIIFGNIAPKLPHNRYTGLRLPWTVNDAETWLVAHRLLGYLAFPCGILCLAGVVSPEASVKIPMMMLFIWIIVPSVLSYIFYYRKWHRKKK